MLKILMALMSIVSIVSFSPKQTTVPSVMFVGDSIDASLVTSVEQTLSSRSRVVSISEVDKVLSEISASGASVVVVDMNLNPLWSDEENIAAFERIAQATRAMNQTLIVVDQLEIADVVSAVAIDTESCGSNWCAIEAILQAVD